MRFHDALFYLSWLPLKVLWPDVGPANQSHVRHPHTLKQSLLALIILFFKLQLKKKSPHLCCL